MAIKDQVYWYTLLPEPKGQVLANDISVDVAIVGGGMAGLMAAQEAKKLGASVAVLEGQYCGAGASGKSSGFITPDSELELSTLIAGYGPSCAKELWDFVVSGCEGIRKNIIDYELACDYIVQDSLFIANTEKGKEKVRHEYEARKQLEYEAALYKDSASLEPVIGSGKYYGGVRYPGTFGINSYLYCQGLKKILENQGVAIYEQTPVAGLSGQTLRTASGKTVAAEKIIFCADRFLPDLDIVPEDIYQAQTFLSLSAPLSPAEQKKLFPGDQMMVWDTDLIYQYFRLTGEGRLLLGGASMLYTYLPKEKHMPERIINKLQSYLKEKFPWFKVEFEYLWPGLIGVSKDFLPVAGECRGRNNIYYVGGAAGLPWAAALGGYIVRRALGGPRTPFDGYFATPRRYPIGYTLQSFLGKPVTFAITHGITKYLK